ncbi:MAG TPA: hypothetical protein VKQ06_01255, partial [Gammaproteobacteria bacterium]|nr:hypothetical protein [Gammaproteobacteria bacterium]
MNVRHCCTVILCAIVAMLVTRSAAAQDAQREPPQSTTATAPVRGIYNWIHTSGDAELAFEFYRHVFGIELAPSPFYGDPNVRPSGIRPVSEAGSDELVWDLTNTHGARFRTAFLSATNTPFGLELAEFFDIPRNTRAEQPWDPGASMLIFAVRDLASILARARDLDAPIVTRDGAPLDTPLGRSIVMRNPDGYLIQAVQARPEAIAASAAGAVIGSSIGITVAYTAYAMAFYRVLLGFEIAATRTSTDAELP